jgi:hypothetical protein
MSAGLSTTVKPDETAPSSAGKDADIQAGTYFLSASEAWQICSLTQHIERMTSDHGTGHSTIRGKMIGSM